MTGTTMTKDENMTQGGWVAVSLSASLKPSTSTGTLIDGKEYAVWRDNANAAHVWEDRCPHRGMRMSFGFVRGDHIACLYHGWQYDGAGQCRYVPAHPQLEVPQTIKVPTFHALESGGLIWASVEEQQPDAPSIPASEVTPVRSLYIDQPLGPTMAALSTVTIPGFTETTSVTALATVTHEAVIATIGADRLLIAGQSLNADRCALHIVILGPESVYAGAGQTHFARWGEGFRNGLEAAANGEAA